MGKRDDRAEGEERADKGGGETAVKTGLETGAKTLPNAGGDPKPSDGGCAVPPLEIRLRFQERAIARIVEFVGTQAAHNSPREAARLVSDVGMLLRCQEPPAPGRGSAGRVPTQRDQVRGAMGGDAAL